MRGGERYNQYLFGLGTERPCGLMDKASVSDTGDCKFESCQGRQGFFLALIQKKEDAETELFIVVFNSILNLVFWGITLNSEK